MASKETSTRVAVHHLRQETSWSISGAPSFRGSSWSSSDSQKFLIESSSDEGSLKCSSSEMILLELIKTREDDMASSGSSGVRSMSSSSQTDAVPEPSSSGEDQMSNSNLDENEEDFQGDDFSTSASSGEALISLANSILSNASSRREGGGGSERGGDGVIALWNANQMLSLTRELEAALLLMAENLDKLHKRFNVARVTGGSVATVGALVAIGAGIAIPFTFGVSIIIAIIGGAVAAAGGVTAGGAGIYKYIMDKKKLKEANQKWADFANMFRNALKDRDNCANQTGSGSSGLGTSAGSAGGAVFAGVAREAALAVGGAGGRIGATAGQLAAAAASATVVINVITLGFSLYDIIDGSLEIHRERKSPAGDIIRNMAKDLETLNAHLEGRQNGE